MLGRSAGALAASALSASAFLIPAGIAPADAKLKNLDWWMEASTEARLVRLPCSSCVFWSPEENIEDAENDIFRIQGGAHDVMLNYTVDHDGETLLMNDAPIFHMRHGVQLGIKTSVYHVEQIPASASWLEYFSKEVVTTTAEITGAGVSTTDITELKNGDMVTKLRSSIHSLGVSGKDIPVDLEPVVMDLVQPKEGKLLILGLSAENRPQTGLPPPPYPADFFGPVDVEDEEDGPFAEEPLEFEILPPPHAASDEHGEASSVAETDRAHEAQRFNGCKSLPPPICRLKHMLESKFRGMKKPGCPGRMGGRPFPRPHNGVLPSHIKAPPFPRPDFEVDAAPMHHGRPHGHHHGHHHRFHFLHAVARGIAAILIPTMAGIAVGMTVSLVGLAVGRLISFIWIHTVRGGRRGYASLALEEQSAGEGEVSKTSMEEEEDREPLPLYEEAPAYEENEKAAQ